MRAFAQKSGEHYANFAKEKFALLKNLTVKVLVSHLSKTLTA
jgi:hypothetical protein